MELKPEDFDNMAPGELMVERSQDPARDYAPWIPDFNQIRTLAPRMTATQRESMRHVVITTMDWLISRTEPRT